MKKYLVFGGSNYYPCGGADDFKKGFDDIETAKKYVDNNRIEFRTGMQATDIEDDEDMEFHLGLLDSWAHIVDRDTMKVLEFAYFSGYDLFDWKKPLTN